MKKIIYGSIGLVLAIGIIIGIIIGVVLSGEDYAELQIDRGVVEIFDNEWITATNGMKLGLNDHIRTLDGEATILFDNLITQLDPNTEIIIKNLNDVEVEQISGSTWNKLIGLLGGNQVTVKNQRVVAMVRGTSFGVGNLKLLVGEGKVEGKLDGFEELVLAKQTLTMINGTPGVRNLIPEEQEYIVTHIQKSLKILRELRLKEINNHPIATKLILKIAGLDEPIEEILKKVDNKEYDYKQFLDKNPIPLKKLEYVIILTEEIIKLENVLQEM